MLGSSVQSCATPTVTDYEASSLSYISRVESTCTSSDHSVPDAAVHQDLSILLR